MESVVVGSQGYSIKTVFYRGFSKLGQGLHVLVDFLDFRVGTEFCRAGTLPMWFSNLFFQTDS